MKKKTAPQSKPAVKRNPPKNVDEYLAAVPEPALSALSNMRVAIRSCVPTEAVEVISYGIPAFKHKRVLVWFAAFAKHCSLFPTNSVMELFKDELAGYKVSKGTVHFSLGKPIPTALIKKMVKARVAQTKES